MLNYLVCYKSEYGLALQRMIESYNILLVLQFEGFHLEERAITRLYTEKLKEVENKITELDQNKARL
jgi:hypothetical protein